MMEKDTVYENIRQDYLARLQEYNALENNYKEKREKYEEQKQRAWTRLERLEKKRLKNIFPRWTQLLFCPVLDELERRTPEIMWLECEELLTFGLRAECPVLGETETGRTVGITFTCDHKAWLYYDTEKKVIPQAPLAK